MISYLMKKIVGSQNEREIKRLTSVAEAANEFENDLIKLSNTALREKTNQFSQKVKSALNGGDVMEDEQQAGILEDTLWEILPESFAIAREASRRTLGMRCVMRAPTRTTWACCSRSCGQTRRWVRVESSWRGSKAWVRNHAWSWVAGSIDSRPMLVRQISNRPV